MPRLVLKLTVRLRGEPLVAGPINARYDNPGFSAAWQPRGIPRAEKRPSATGVI
jgi:hypothetical protein